MLVYTYWYRMDKGKKVIPRSLFPSSGSASAHLEAAGFRGACWGASILLTLGQVPFPAIK